MLVALTIAYNTSVLIELSASSERLRTSNLPYQNNDYRHPTWRSWYDALTVGGDTQFTTGGISRDTCSTDAPLRGDTVGAFSDPTQFWSAASVVQFDAEEFPDRKPRLVDVRSTCCRSEHQWPKCWADDIPTLSVEKRAMNPQTHRKKERPSNVLRSMFADKRKFKNAGITTANLADGTLTLECVDGAGPPLYAESVGAFKWKRLPPQTTKIENITSSAVVVRCRCSRGVWQRLREFFQLHMHKWGLPRQTSFLERYFLENEQCIGSDLFLLQVFERPAVQARLEQIWGDRVLPVSKPAASRVVADADADEENQDYDHSTTSTKEQRTINATLMPALNVVFVHLDSTSRRHWVNNARETTAALRKLSEDNVSTTFAFPFFHSLGKGHTERAFSAGMGGSRITNFGEATYSEWKMMHWIWDHARDAGWFTSYAAEYCFGHETRSLFNAAPANMSLIEKLRALGDHTMYDAFCGSCNTAKETFCDSGTKKRTQYRNGEYYTKNFLADERSCEGGRRPSSNFWEFTRKAINAYGAGKYPSLHVYDWASAHLFREEKHVCAAMRHFDASLAAFVRDLTTSGLMERTVFIVCADHSNWHIEELQNAACSITVPDALLDLLGKDARQNLHRNQREVVTHLDVHATLMHLIEWQTGPHSLAQSKASFSFPAPTEGVPILPAVKVKGLDVKGWRGWRYGQSDFPGKSLFLSLPPDRGCQRAGVDGNMKGSCLVRTKSQGKVQDITSLVQACNPLLRALAERVASATNRNVRDMFRPTCKPFAFDSLRSAMTRLPSPDGGHDSVGVKSYKLIVKYFVRPFSSGASKREFQCDVFSKLNLFELLKNPGHSCSDDSIMTMVDFAVDPKACKQTTKWGMNKDCMPPGIGKREQGYCQCLNDAGVTVEGFRL